MKDRKSLYLVTIGTLLASTIAVAAYSASNLKVFDSLAGGIVQTSDKGRILTLDSATPLVVDGAGKGTVSLGNVTAYSPECTAIAGGVANFGSRGMVLYCPTTDKNGDYYNGFVTTTVNRVVATFNGEASARTVKMCWARTNGDTISFYTSDAYNEITVSASTPDQEFTFTEDDTFLKKQSTPKKDSNKYTCLYMYVKSGTLDLVNLTVEYTCS